MIPAEIRKLMDSHLATARETESDAAAEANLSIFMGYIGYAVARGDITQAQHSNEFMAVRLVREQRANARRAKVAA